MNDELREVVLLRLPLALRRRALQRHEELFRELALIANPHPESQGAVPERLLGLVAALRERFGTFTDKPDEEIEAAEERGDAVVDVTYRVPASAAAAAEELLALLTKADEYCRSGDLLTLAAEPLLIDYRRWYLTQFSAQIAGEPPVPWSGPPQ